MTNIFPIDFEEKLTMAQNDYILFSDSEDWNKIKKAQYKNLKGEKGDKWDKGDTWATWPQWPQWIQGIQWPQWEQGEQWEKGDTGTAATITVWTTTTWEPWTSASVTNSWTSSAAVFDFVIPEWEKWDKGDKGDTWTAATITVWTTTTWWAWTSASVTNSGTSSAAILDFTIPKWDKGDKWDTWATGTAATISVGTTTTWDAWTSASVTNSWTSSAAVFDFTIPKWDKGDKWDTWNTWAAATITVWTTTTGDAGTNASVTNSGTSSAAIFDFTIPKWDKWDTGATWSAATISVWSTTTWDAGTSASVVNSWTSSAAVFDFTIPKWDKGDTWNTWATGNGIASVTSSKSWKVTTVTITETDGDVSSFTVSDWADGEWSGDVIWPASSTDGDIVLFDGVTGKLIKDGSKSLSDLVQTSWNQTVAGTKTFSTSPVVPNKTSTATNTGTAIATEAQVYTVADAVSTINWKISSNASSSNKLMDKTYIDDAINSVAAYYITKNAAWDQFATYAELSAATTFYSWGVARIPTRNDYTIVLADENHDNATTRYIYNSGWEYQYTVNETALTQSQLDALNSWITSWKVSTYDGYASTISWKQDALTLPSSPTQWNLVVRWANNKTIADGWAIPTVPTNVSSFNNDAWYLTSETVVSGDSWTTYTIKVANSDPTSWTPATTITFVL